LNERRTVAGAAPSVDAPAPPFGRHGPDVVAVMHVEHEQLRSALRALRVAPTPTRRGVDQLIADVVAHETVEEELLHPLLHQLEAGRSLRRDLLAEERALTSRLVGLRRSLRWYRRRRHLPAELQALGEALERHLHHEEALVFPAVEGHEPETALQIRGTWAARARRFTPTRPHPHVPQGAGLLFVTPFVALLDRSLDRLVGRRLLDPRRGRARR